MLTGEVWLSPAGCGLNASQELLMFLTHQHRLGQLGHVVVLSGLNSLAHEALCEVLASPNDPQHAKAYQAFLNSFSEGMQATAPLRRQSLWRRIGQALATPAVAAPVSWPLSPPEKRLARAADNIGRTLRQWDRLLADSHATLTFILQPLLPGAGIPCPLASKPCWPRCSNNRRTSTGCWKAPSTANCTRRFSAASEPGRPGALLRHELHAQQLARVRRRPVHRSPAPERSGQQRPGQGDHRQAWPGPGKTRATQVTPIKLV
jgi:hypothetical protein